MTETHKTQIPNFAERADEVVDVPRVFVMQRRGAQDFQPSAVIADTTVRVVAESFDQMFVVIPVEFMDDQHCARRQVRGGVEDVGVADLGTHCGHYSEGPPCDGRSTSNATRAVEATGLS